MFVHLYPTNFPSACTFEIHYLFQLKSVCLSYRLAYSFYLLSILANIPSNFINICRCLRQLFEKCIDVASFVVHNCSKREINNANRYLYIEKGLYLQKTSLIGLKFGDINIFSIQNESQFHILRYHFNPQNEFLKLLKIQIKYS